jgi:peptide/nickel transport system permease protein
MWKKYIFKRLIVNIFAFWIIVTVSFLIFRLLGNPITMMIGPGAPPGTAELLTKEFGLDKPLWEQYFLFWINLFHGNMGISFVYTGTNVINVIFPTRFLNTLILMGSGLFFSIIISLLLGLYAAKSPGGKLDKFMSGLTGILISIPSYWLAMIILLIFSFYFGWLPMGGTISPNLRITSLYGYVVDYIYHLVGPLITITIFFLSSNYLIIKSSAQRIFQEDFIKSLRIMGVKENRIIFHHVLKNSILPELSQIAVQMSFLIAGAIFTETVFSLNGMGTLIYIAVTNSDYPVLQGVFIFMSLLVIISNFIADLLYGYIDPRVRLG